MIDLPPVTSLIANTGRLCIVPIAPGDATEMFTVLNDPRLHLFTGGAPLPETELAELYRALQERRNAEGTEVWASWVLRLVPLGEGIGQVDAVITDDGHARVSCVIGARWAGHRFASEAAVAIARVLQAHLGVTWLEAVIHPDHTAAQRLARRVGMVPTGAVGAAGGDCWAGAPLPGSSTPEPSLTLAEAAAAAGRESVSRGGAPT